MLNILFVLLVLAFPLHLTGPGLDLAIREQACPMCVAADSGSVSLFGAAWERGSIGLLAHDYLAGLQFAGLAVGDSLRLDYSSGEGEEYIIKDILIYRATRPGVAWTPVVDESGQKLSQAQVFEQVYQPGRLVLQTCYGGLYRGWLFVVAERRRISDSEQWRLE